MTRHLFTCPKPTAVAERHPCSYHILTSSWVTPHLFLKYSSQIVCLGWWWMFSLSVGLYPQADHRCPLMSYIRSPQLHMLLHAKRENARSSFSNTKETFWSLHHSGYFFLLFYIINLLTYLSKQCKLVIFAVQIVPVIDQWSVNDVAQIYMRPWTTWFHLSCRPCFWCSTFGFACIVWSGGVFLIFIIKCVDLESVYTQVTLHHTSQHFPDQHILKLV